MRNRVKSKLNGHVNGHAAPAVAPSPTVLNGETDKAKNDRGTDGRFSPGNKAACGNPHNRRVARLRSVLLDAVSDDDLEAVARKLVVLAKRGDVGAAKLLLAYLIGKPAAAPDPDLLDKAEWLLAQEGPPNTLLALSTIGNLTFAEALVKWANMKADMPPRITPLMPDPETDNEVNP